MTSPVPSRSNTILDGGLALVASTEGPSFKVGTSSSGTAGTFYSYQGLDVNRVYTDLGAGPLPDAVALHLILSGGKQVHAYKSAATTAGSSGSVSQSGAGPLPTLTGAPYDFYQSRVLIVAGGAVGTATFKYSLDGGDTYSDVYTTAATFALPSGVTVNFTAGTYVADELYSWTDTAPIMSTTNVGDACDDIIASALAGEFVHVLGQAASAADAATMCALLQTKMEAAHAAHRYLYAIMEAPAVAKAGLVSAFAAVSAKYVSVCAGFAEIINPSTSYIEKRSSARVLVPRNSRNPLATHVLRNEADSNIESISAVDELVPAGSVDADSYVDSGSDSTLNDARFSTLMTIVGYEGVYPCHMMTMAPVGSDFQDLPYLRVILSGAQAWDSYAIRQLAKRLPTVAGGKIMPAVAEAMEKEGRAVVLAALGPNAQEVQVLINRDDNIASTRILNAELRIQVGTFVFTFNTQIGLASNLVAA